MTQGRCDCGAVRFTAKDLRDTVTVCHCGQCRRTSGHLWASTTVPSWASITFETDAGLTWYESSGFARRGFCKHCGASLFYELHDADKIAIAAGCLDLPTGMTTGKHIYVEDKGDYYQIADTAPQFDTY